MILPLFRRNRRDDSIHGLYGAIVAQARLPVFYAGYRVPDIVEGRLEMVMLHTVLLLHRVEAGGDGLRPLGQAVFDRFCQDMDDNLREMGVGDLSVPKQMQQIAGAFYGRTRIYREALADADPARLVNALRRNIYSDEPAADASAGRFAAYVRNVVAHLRRQDATAFWAGRVSFPMPSAAETAPLNTMSKISSPQPWSVPLAVQAVPPEGQQLHLAADAHARAAVARLAGVREIGRLEADVSVLPHGSAGLHVTGQVSALVGQTCVVTLEPMQSEVEEAIDVLYLSNPPKRTPADGSGEEDGTLGDERIETLAGDTIDLGAIATEFLILGIDPYPRKPGAEFTPPAAGESSSHPFAALAALKKAPGEGGE